MFVHRTSLTALLILALLGNRELQRSYFLDPIAGGALR